MQGICPVSYTHLRYVDAEEDADMFDTIRECVSIDVGRIFCTSYNNLTYSAFRNAIKAKNGNWKVAARPANSQMTDVYKRQIFENTNS